MGSLRARVSSTLLLVCGLAACRDSTAPQAGPPANVTVTAGANFVGTVGTLVETPLAVRVTDEQGRAVRGATVRFSLTQGSGVLAPQSVGTNRDGVAATRLTLGPAAGAYQVVASVAGIELQGRFAGVANAGPAARVVVTPGQVRLASVGDTARLRARTYDAHGNVVSSSGISWAAADLGVFAIDQAGLVTGSAALSVGRAIASADGRADTAYVVVANPEASHCLGYPAPISLAVGQTASVSMSDGICIAGTAAAEYVVIPWHGSSAAGSTVNLQVTGHGLSGVTTPQVVAPAGAAWTAREAVRPFTDPERRFDVERQIREAGRREVMPLARRARDRLLAPSAQRTRTAAIPASLALGDHIELNANARASCTSPSVRTGRVAAVSARAIVVHDTANPAGGFTDADYQRFAVTFDTLVAPVSEAAFGAPTDVDRNGKVVIFFTRAVNELTPPGANFYYGGFFHPRDLLPRVQDDPASCAGSNQGEMFYMLVPDTEGVVNGNRRRVSFVDTVTIGTLAHEYQHLINAGRRMYVARTPIDEEVWLNEGLSHVAEELVFYRATGAGPRQNLGGERFGASAYDALFLQYMAPNFGRLSSYLQNPHISSPYSAGDELATRGAAWAFLRYAADRSGGVDGDVWMRLVNSQTAGLANLRAVFGPNVLAMISDWAVSLYADDYIPGVGVVFTQPSWNFRSAYPALPASARSYPLVDAVRSMEDGVRQAVTVRGGGAAFLRFNVGAGRDAAIRVNAGGVVPPPTVQATVVRRQ